MPTNQTYKSVIVIFLGLSDQLHALVNFGDFINFSYTINEHTDYYYFNHNYLDHFVLKYIDKIQVEEYIDLSGYVLQHKSIADIDLNNKSLLSTDLQKDIQNRHREYCKYYKLDLHTGESILINRTGFARKIQKFIQTTDDNTEELPSYYIFLKKESNSEIEEMLTFETLEKMKDWISQSDVVWLD